MTSDITMLRRPKLVYLDTQDFSRLADVDFNGRGGELQRVYEELKLLADSGDFQFCFSTVLVGELLQVAPPHIDIARRKAEVVERLCSSCAFPHPMWLFRRELETFAAGYSFGVHSELRTDIRKVVLGGRWLAEEIGDVKSILDGLDAQLENRTAGLSRADRRLFKHRLRRQPAERYIASFSKHPMYPMIKEAGIDLLMADALKGKKPRHLVATSLTKAMARPTNLVRYPENYAPVAGLNEGLKKHGQVWLGILTKFRAEVDRLREELRVPPPPDTLRAMLRSGLPHVG